MGADIRERINKMAGRKHELTRQILGIDWFDLNSQARRAIEYIADQEENLQTRFVGEVKHKAPGHINWDDWPTNLPEGTKLYIVTEPFGLAPTQTEQPNHYVVKAGSASGHCCFDATVVNTTVDCGNTAECFDEEDARRIAACLNICDGIATEVLEKRAEARASDTGRT